MAGIASRALIKLEIERREGLLRQYRTPLEDPEREAERLRFIHRVTLELESARTSLADAAPNDRADRRRRILTANHLAARIPKLDIPDTDT